MTEDKKPTPKTSNERQRDLKARRIAEGYKHTTVWIHEETAMEGIRAARAGKPLQPMESKDPLSWAAGWISEKSKQ
ncbi:hypothetical protein [Pseudomonas orientalis]|uniref:Uncharacterized protein n=1 Tax=Pseudomonas orientalis TaxID=76758 RepID=A0A4Q7CYP0_9PSED|nr:hypothetical protein [Pseudomonas orientalis]RZI31153.1 hypothetical protein EUX57_14140 [Pseudomonas orientalis]